MWFSSLCSCHSPLLELCSCQVNKEAASSWSPFDGKPSCSCKSSSGVNLSSSWRKCHGVANYSFSYDEGELHIYNCQLQYRGHEVRRLMGQEGYLLNISYCMFLFSPLCSFYFQCLQFLFFMLEPCKVRVKKLFHTISYIHILSCFLLVHLCRDVR